MVSVQAPSLIAFSHGFGGIFAVRLTSARALSSRFGLTHMSALRDLVVGALEPQSAAKTDLRVPETHTFYEPCAKVTSPMR